eukprot:TRINITY_DN924_c0_g1_i1.p2 TRINITY_DN924_c0_g1~~TRINITY_DN924_c0_g1_i1.p2  ORF type:complete len:102 (-),score=27.18 TRINITY_DN924_c0_g1_i1:752-1057(-)
MEYDNEEYNWQPFLDVDAPFPGQVSPYATTVDETLTDIFSCLDLKQEKDAIVDLGSGDGKIIHYAAIKYGIFGLGLVIILPYLYIFIHTYLDYYFNRNTDV